MPWEHSDIIKRAFQSKKWLTWFFSTSTRTSHYGLNSLRYFAAKVWNIVPKEIKNIKDLGEFKRKIRDWEPNNSHSELCRIYFHNVRYAFYLLYVWFPDNIHIVDKLEIRIFNMSDILLILWIVFFVWIYNSIVFNHTLKFYCWCVISLF